jgi:hypothetical protein
MERGLHYSIVVEKPENTGKACKRKHLKLFPSLRTHGFKAFSICLLAFRQSMGFQIREFSSFPSFFTNYGERAPLFHSC